LATDIYGVAYGIKNADGILLGGFDMVNVQKNLSPDLIGTLKVIKSLGTSQSDLGSSVMTLNCARKHLARKGLSNLLSKFI
jgi:uncharacterized protein YoxC